MCARYVLDKDIDIVEKRFNAGVKGHHEFTARYNVAPSQTMPVVTGEGVLEFLPWGYAPDWAEKKVINARLESIEEKPYFRDALRCLVPATGFYEWKSVDGKKMPQLIQYPDRRLFAFAGLCNEKGYSIVTQEAAGLVQEIHTRMPVILTLENESGWLVGATGEYPAQALELVPVSTLVNSPSTDVAECIARA